MLPFVTLVSESKPSINDMLDCYNHLGDHGFIDQGSSLYTCQGHLLWTATSRVVHVEDSLSAWSAEEDCV
jgi:hypothetical protein